MPLQRCPACSHSNEPPFLLCGGCGAAQVHLGHLRILLNLALTMAAFMGTFYFFVDFLSWPWPLYTLFALFTMQFMLAQVAGRWGLMLRFGCWYLASFALFGAFFTILHTFSDAGIFLTALAFGPEVADQYPLVFYPTLGVLATLTLLPGYFYWRRKYGWHNAYRILLLTVLVIAATLLLALQGAEWSHQRNFFPEQSKFLGELVNKVKPAYDEAFGLIGVIALRIFLFEIFIFSALRGYVEAQRSKMPALRSPRGEPGFIRSLMMIAMVVRRFMLLLEQMLRCMAGTMRELAKALGQVIAAFIRELLIPTLAMIATATLLYQLAMATRSYIEANEVWAAARLFGSLVGLLVFTMVFIGCKTNYRWKRILAFSLELTGWLLPNLMIFFLLSSICLWLTGLVLNAHSPAEDALPFRLGPLTIVDGGLLAALVVFILIRKRALFKAEPAAQGAVTVKVAEMPEETEARVEAGMEHALRGGIGKVADSARSFTSAVQETLRSSAEGLKGRMQGKPAIVEQVAQARRQCEEAAARYRTMESLKGTISPEAYEELWNKQRSELTYLTVRRDQLQLDLERQYAERQLEKAACEASLASLRRQQEELAQVGRSGVLGEKAARQRLEKLEVQLGVQTERLKNCERVIQFLLPEIALCADAAGAPARTQAGAEGKIGINAKKD